MVSNLSRVDHQLKMSKIIKRGEKIKLLPFLTKSMIWFKIFSQLLFEYKNGDLFYVTKLMTSFIMLISMNEQEKNVFFIDLVNVSASYN